MERKRRRPQPPQTPPLYQLILSSRTQQPGPLDKYKPLADDNASEWFYFAGIDAKGRLSIKWKNEDGMLQCINLTGLETTKLFEILSEASDIWPRHFEDDDDDDE
jgi:hypothetical protein